MDIRELYQKGLDRFTFNAAAMNLLTHISNGTDNSVAYEDYLATDEFFIETFLREAFPLSQEPLKTIAQAVSLLGRERSRNFTFSHLLNRIFDPKADSNFRDIQTSLKTLKRSLEAETTARQMQIEKPEIAFVAGLIFDFFELWILNEPGLKQKYTNFIENLWRHSLRSAAIAGTLGNSRRVKITGTQTAFAAALLHDSGKALLALSAPDSYPSVILDSKLLQKSSPTSDAYEVDLELESIGLAHPESASLLLWQLDPLRNLEALVEYHHEFSFLPIRNAELNTIEVLVAIADKFAFFLEHSSVLDLTTVTDIIKPHSKYFKLSPSDTLDTLITLRANSTVV